MAKQKWRTDQQAETSLPLLQVDHLKTYFFMDDGQIAKAVDDVSFSILKGETVALVGESGSGKSVTSQSIMQLVPDPGKIINGSIQLDGEDLLSLSGHKLPAIRGNDIGMIFQEPMTSLDPVFTIGNQMIEPLMKHKKMGKREAWTTSIHLLNQVGISRADNIMDEYPHQLSGGMKQRVMIASAMSCDPKLLIADEPTTALDVTIQAQILDILLGMKESSGTSILLITHDLGVVAEMADRVLVMYGGQIVEEANVEDLFNHAKHPYTEALMDSLPNLEHDQHRLHPIPGSVPPPTDFPEGCRFADRCKYTMAKCRLANPELLDQGAGHKVRCYLYE